MNFINIEESILDTGLTVEHIIQENNKTYAEISFNRRNDFDYQKENNLNFVYNQRKYLRDLVQSSISIHTSKTINKLEYALFSVCPITHNVENMSLYIKETLSNYFMKNDYIMLDNISFNEVKKSLKVSLLSIPF